MRKIGATSGGTVIVEMTIAQFDALSQVMHPARPQAANGNSPGSEVRSMAVRRKLEYVRSCILKLRPGTHDELVRCIQSVHKTMGGVGDKEIEQILRILLREGTFSIGGDGVVGYQVTGPDNGAGPLFTGQQTGHAP